MEKTKQLIEEETAVFLSRLGIEYGEDVSKESYWKECHHMVREAGGNPDTALVGNNLMSQDAVNMYFLTPEIACRFLAADIQRLHTVFQALDFLKPIPENAETIVEIGGGPGIISLWLAQKHPEKTFTVFDYAENPLKIGRKWAKQLGIKNINYAHKSYSELASEPQSKKFDVVLGLSVLDLQVRSELSSPNLSIEEVSLDIVTPKTTLLNEFAGACRQCIRSDGSLYFSQGGFDDAGLYLLFSALRNAGFGIDWERTVTRGEGEGAAFSFKEIHITAAPALPTVFKDAGEDTRSFLYRGAVSSFDKKTILGFSDFETWLSLLKDGTKLADIRATRSECPPERFTIYIRDGVLGFFSSNGDGSRSGFIYCAASWFSSCQRLNAVIASYRKKGAIVSEEFWHPVFLERLNS